MLSQTEIETEAAALESSFWKLLQLGTNKGNGQHKNQTLYF